MRRTVTRALASRHHRPALAGVLLDSRSATSAAQVVRELGAVQAQDFHGAKWAIAQRARGLTDADIDREFDRGDLIRTHVLRPTWHFVAPEDARWMLALTGERIARDDGPLQRPVQARRQGLPPQQ